MYMDIRTYACIYAYKKKAIKIFWVCILGFYLIVSIHAYMYTYTATYFNNFVICLIVKYLFLF